jgi:hypothetical protein
MYTTHALLLVVSQTYELAYHHAMTWWLTMHYILLYHHAHIHSGLYFAVICTLLHWLSDIWARCHGTTVNVVYCTHSTGLYRPYNIVALSRRHMSSLTTAQIDYARYYLHYPSAHIWTVPLHLCYLCICCLTDTHHISLHMTLHKWTTNPSIWAELHHPHSPCIVLQTHKFVYHSTIDYASVLSDCSTDALSCTHISAPKLVNCPVLLLHPTMLGTMVLSCTHSQGVHIVHTLLHCPTLDKWVYIWPCTTVLSYTHTVRS